MGQHKYNQTAQLAKDGKLPPKPERKSKRQIEREIHALIARETGLDKLYSSGAVKRCYW